MVFLIMHRISKGSVTPDDIPHPHHTDRHIENGQAYEMCHCGAIWAVVECVDERTGEVYEDYEQIAEGDEDYHIDDY